MFKKILIVIGAVLLFLICFAIFKSISLDMDISSHNRKVITGLDNFYLDNISVLCSYWTGFNTGGIASLKDKYNHPPLNFRLSCSGNSIYTFPMYLDKKHILGVRYQSILLSENFTCIDEIDFEKDEIVFISNVEKDIDKPSDYIFYVITSNHMDTEKTFFLKYRITSDYKIICESKLKIVPFFLESDIQSYGNSMQYKNIDGNISFYIASYNYPNTLFHFNEDGVVIEKKEGVDLVCLNSAFDEDLYFIKNTDSKGTIFKNGKKIKTFDTELLQARILSDGSIFIIVRSGLPNGFCFFLEGKRFSPKLAYRYDVNTDTIFDFYLKSYKGPRDNTLENMGVLTRGFLMPYYWNIVPYR